MDPSNPETVISRLSQAQQNKRQLEELYVELADLKSKRKIEESENRGNWFTNLSIQKLQYEINDLLKFNRSVMFAIPGGKDGKRDNVAYPPAKNAQLKSGTTGREGQEPDSGGNNSIP